MASAKRVRPPGPSAQPTSRVRERQAEYGPIGHPGIRYVETSALLAAFLEADAAARQAIRGAGRLITSALTHAEAARAIQRARTARRLSASQATLLVRGLQVFAERCETVAVGREVLARVGQAFPVEPLRTLDAIHLATVELIGVAPASVVVVTRDSRVRENATAMGWRVE